MLARAHNSPMVVLQIPAVRCQQSDTIPLPAVCKLPFLPAMYWTAFLLIALLVGGLGLHGFVLQPLGNYKLLSAKVYILTPVHLT